MSDRTDPEVELLQAVPTRLADIREFERELIAAAEVADGESHEDAPAEDAPAARPADPLDGVADDELPTKFIQLPDQYKTDAPPMTTDTEVGAWHGGYAAEAAVATDDTAVGAWNGGYAADAAAVTADAGGGIWDGGYAADAAAVTPGAEGFTEPERVTAQTVVTRPSRLRLPTWVVVSIVVCVVAAINVGFLLGLSMNGEKVATPPVTAAMPSAPTTEAAAPPTEAAAMPAAEVPALAKSTGASEAPAPAAEVETEVAAEAEAEVVTGETPLVLAQRAIEAADADAAAVALEAARDAGAEPSSLDRLRAQLMVLRGDGAAAVSELRAMTTAYADEPAVWLALGRVLSQAEDDAAERAFRRALELDEHSVDAHVGIARLATRAARLRTARQHLGSAREAYEQGEPDPVLEARLHVTEGIIGFELGDYRGASSHAERALALDEKSAEAHLLLGRIAIQQDRDEDAAEHLRAAAAGRAPPAEALGMLVPRAGEDACELADRYLVVAPSGFDARAVRRAKRRCR